MRKHVDIGIITLIQTILIIILMYSMVSSMSSFYQSELEIYPLLFVLFIIFFQGIAILWMMTKVVANGLFLWKLWKHKRHNLLHQTLTQWHIIHLSYLLACSVISVMYLSIEPLRALMSWSIFEHVLCIMVVISMFMMSGLIYRNLQDKSSRRYGQLKESL